MQTKKIAILQSNFLSWRGYFDIINTVDEFIIYDHVQYTKNDWRNRNLIASKTGPQWITIPVKTKGHLTKNRPINETTVIDKKWIKKHLGAFRNNYSKAKYFKNVYTFLEEIYTSASDYTYLSAINKLFIKRICNLINIKTYISSDIDYIIQGDKNTKLINLIKQANGTIYYSGIAAKNYLDEELFNKNNIEIRWIDSTNYPKYKQFCPEYFFNLSIVDLLFMEGNNFYKYMKTIGEVNDMRII